jgi:NTE family protein
MGTSKIPPQRALVLQGSVALGAFEAGVFKALYNKLFRPGEQLFDIVAGTSAGAINAAILVSYVKENKTWEGSAERLEEYWRDHLASPTPPIGNIGRFWLGEAARRYYSTKHFFTFGAPNVFFPSLPFPSPDYKFFDNNPLFPPTNLWFRYNNQPLSDSLEKRDKNGQRFINFPLKTSFDEKEPRFLAVSVDVELAKAVTFDSYYNLSRFESYYDPQIKKSREYVLGYEQGIMPEHVMASASFPVFFDYEKVDGRRFWDGGILSNTPLRQVLQAHRDYWLKDRSEKVPDLDVYLVNVWPSEEKSIPFDHDGVKDRRNDITYADKTEYDQKMALVVTDYVDFINGLRNIAADAVNAVNDDTKKRQLQGRIDELLEKKGRSFKRTGNRRKYRDLIEGRFYLNQVITIERRDDPCSISNKWADYTSETIDMLIAEGKEYQRTAIVRVFPPAEQAETPSPRLSEA